MMADKVNVLGVLVSVTDYESAVAEICDAAEARQPFGVSALAVHGVMTGVADREHRYRLNSLHLVTPDGQPVRWAMGWLGGIRLKDRVYGPTLTLGVCKEAARRNLRVYFFGSREEVLTRLIENLQLAFPGLQVAGSEASRFRRLSKNEKQELADRITDARADIVFVGLGCPRQETFVYEFMDDLSVPMLAVGTAFDYHAGLLKQPSEWIQQWGLQWAYRLVQNPRRLWKRYVLLNPLFLVLLVGQKIRVWKPNAKGLQPIDEMRYG